MRADLSWKQGRSDFFFLSSNRLAYRIGSTFLLLILHLWSCHSMHLMNTVLAETLLQLTEHKTSIFQVCTLCWDGQGINSTLFKLNSSSFSTLKRSKALKKKSGVQTCKNVCKLLVPSNTSDFTCWYKIKYYPGREHIKIFILMIKGTKCKVLLNVIKPNLVHYMALSTSFLTFSFFSSWEDCLALLDIRNLSE